MRWYYRRRERAATRTVWTKHACRSDFRSFGFETRTTCWRQSVNTPIWLRLELKTGRGAAFIRVGSNLPPPPVLFDEMSTIQTHGKNGFETRFERFPGFDKTEQAEHFLLTSTSSPTIKSDSPFSRERERESLRSSERKSARKWESAGKSKKTETGGKTHTRTHTEIAHRSLFASWVDGMPACPTSITPEPRPTKLINSASRLSAVRFLQHEVKHIQTKKDQRSCPGRNKPVPPPPPAPPRPSSAGLQRATVQNQAAPRPPHVAKTNGTWTGINTQTTQPTHFPKESWYNHTHTR